MSLLPPSRNLVLPLSSSDAFSYIIHTQKKNFNRCLSTILMVFIFNEHVINLTQVINLMCAVQRKPLRIIN